jgi:hypothetical protein
MSFNQPFNYDPQSGRWNLELHKAPKEVYAQCGIKISVDPGFPTGEKGAYYQSKEPSGMVGGSIEIRCFDNLAGWTSVVAFDLNSFIEKMIEIMPKDKVQYNTFLLYDKDVERIKNEKKDAE